MWKNQVRAGAQCNGFSRFYRASFGGICLLLLLLAGAATTSFAGIEHGDAARAFPPSLDSYGDSQMTGLWDVLRNRIRQEPLNLWATVLFLCAILHSFFTHRFLHWSHVLEDREKARAPATADFKEKPSHLSTAARVLHFLGEVEAVFGIWCVPLFVLLAIRLGWGTSVNYFTHTVSYIEPIFVVIIMAIASTRPILRLAENCLGVLARLAGGGPTAWWMASLTVGPILGSLITEPAAMTISALLLAKQFYDCKPSGRLAYATLGLLFVNVSVGGALTHFAAPPVLMVSGTWAWNTPFMFRRFGWVALLGIVLSNALYFLALRKDLAALPRPPRPDAEEDPAAPQRRIPFWVTGVHVAFMVWSVTNAHYTALLVGGFLFFLAFQDVTQEYQHEIQLRSPLLVGFFLAGLVVHGGLQQWWIGPVLSRLTEVRLLLGSAALTSFNDNAAITYLATLVPNLNDSLKYAVVTGALAGGGLTVIANAPNPAGHAILSRFFPDGISPLGLLLGAIPATVVMIVCFLCAR